MVPHIKSQFGSMIHKSFLWAARDDPRPALIKDLLKAIPPEGTIVAYSNYEQRIMKDLATEFPVVENALLDLCDRIFDFLQLVREEYYRP